MSEKAPFRDPLVKIAVVLGILTLLAHLYIHLWIHRMDPGIWGAPLILWPFTLVAAILFPVFVLVCFRLIAMPSTRVKRMGFALLLIGSAVPLFTLSTFAVGGTILADQRNASMSQARQEIVTIAQLEDACRNSEDPSHRQLTARSLYSGFGIATVWKNRDGAMESFVPTKEDLEKRAANVAFTADVRNWERAIGLKIGQVPWLVGTHLACFTLIFFGGLGWQVYRPGTDLEIVQ